MLNSQIPVLANVATSIFQNHDEEDEKKSIENFCDRVWERAMADLNAQIQVTHPSPATIEIPRQGIEIL